MAEHGDLFRLVACVIIIVATKIVLYPSLTTAVEPIGDGAVDFIRCALIGDFPRVLLTPDAGYLPLLSRVIAEALAGVVPLNYLPQAFCWLSLVLAAAFCSVLVLPRFAAIMPSAGPRMGAALLLGTYPDYLSNLPENLGLLSVIPLLWLGLAITEATPWPRIALATLAGALLMMSKPDTVTIAPVFAVAAGIALSRGRWRIATFHGVVTAAALLEVAFALATRVIHGIAWGPPQLASLKAVSVDFLGAVATAAAAGRTLGGPENLAIGAGVLAAIAAGAAFTLRHTRKRADLVWVLCAALLMIVGTLAINALAGFRFAGESRRGLVIVIGLVVIVATLQPFARVTWARRMGWSLAAILIAGAVTNLPRSHDLVDPAKGYAAWERTYFLAQYNPFAIPVNSADDPSALWLMTNGVSFLNSDHEPWRGRPRPLGARPAAHFPLDLAKANGTSVLGAIVALGPNQPATAVEMDVDGSAPGERKKASFNVPLPNGSRYFLLDRPMTGATALSFSVAGTPVPVDPAIALIGEPVGPPAPRASCNSLAMFRQPAG
jgi:hypothetical protein